MRRLFCALVGLLALGADVVPVFSQDVNISIEGVLDSYSQYVWRGKRWADGFVVQPGLTFVFGQAGPALNVWGSAALQDRSAPKQLDQADELNFTLSLDRVLTAEGGVSVSAGYTQYVFPSLAAGTKHSEEFFAGIGVENVVSPSMTAFYDFGQVDAWYVSLRVMPEIPLDREGNTKLSLTAGVSFSNYPRRNEGGQKKFKFHDFTALASVATRMGFLTIRPTFGFSYGEDGIITQANNSVLWGGMSVSVSK